MIRPVIALSALLLATTAQASFTEVTERIEAQRAEAAALNQTRAREFAVSAEVSKQKNAAALAADEALTRRAGAIEATIASQEQAIEALETAFEDAALNTTTLTAAVRQIGAELASRIRQSVVSAEYPQRNAALDALAASPGLPAVATLESAWLTLAGELERSAEFSEFDAAFLDAGGREITTRVTRAGALAVFTGDKYLAWEDNALHEIAGRPQQSPGPYQLLHVEPTRHASLVRELGMRKPLSELIDTAGPVGIVIIVLGLAAIPLFIVRSSILLTARTRRRIRDWHALDRGRLSLRLIATAAPLLGLLGTITGMITAFRSLSLFGQADPATLAGSLGAALLTTAMGLVVAVPVFFMAVALERFQTAIERDHGTGEIPGDGIRP